MLLRRTTHSRTLHKWTGEFIAPSLPGVFTKIFHSFPSMSFVAITNFARSASFRRTFYSPTNHPSLTGCYSPPTRRWDALDGTRIIRTTKIRKKPHPRRRHCMYRCIIMHTTGLLHFPILGKHRVPCCTHLVIINWRRERRLYPFISFQQIVRLPILSQRINFDPYNCPPFPPKNSNWNTKCTKER